MKPVIGASILGLLALGGIAVATSRPARLQASQPAAATAVAPPAAIAAQPASPAPAAAAAQPQAVGPTAQPVRERVVYRDRVVNRTTTQRRHTRSAKKSVAIIGGSALGGAVVGGLIDGKKGAVVGAVVGGAGGTIYDRKTRHRDH